MAKPEPRRAALLKFGPHDGDRPGHRPHRPNSNRHEHEHRRGNGSSEPMNGSRPRAIEQARQSPHEQAEADDHRRELIQPGTDRPVLALTPHGQQSEHETNRMAEHAGQNH